MLEFQKATVDDIDEYMKASIMESVLCSTISSSFLS